MLFRKGGISAVYPQICDAAYRGVVCQPRLVSQRILLHELPVHVAEGRKAGTGTGRSWLAEGQGKKAVETVQVKANRLRGAGTDQDPRLATSK